MKEKDINELIKILKGIMQKEIIKVKILMKNNIIFMLCLLLSISIIQGSEASTTWQTKAENNLSDYFNNNDIDAELYLDGKVVKLREFQLLLHT